MNSLRRHLIQAHQNAKAFTQLQQDLAQLSRTMELIGLIVLSHDDQVQLMTQQAWSLLTRYFQVPSLSVRCLPENLQRWVKNQLSLLVQDSDISLPRLHIEREGKHLSIRLIAQQEGEHLLLLEEQRTLSLSVELLELLGLTQREAEVLFGVFQGKSNKEIAAILKLSSGTIKKHMEHIYQKLEVHSRAAAISRALTRLGMISNINSQRI